MAIIPTCKVKATHPTSQGDYVLINEADFDPRVHKHYKGGAEDEVATGVELAAATPPPAPEPPPEPPPPPAPAPTAKPKLASKH